RRPDARRREPCAARGHQPWRRELGWRWRGRGRRRRLARRREKGRRRPAAPHPAGGVDHLVDPRADHHAAPRAGGESQARVPGRCHERPVQDRKSTRLNSSHLGISYAVFCLKKKKKKTKTNKNNKSQK